MIAAALLALALSATPSIPNDPVSRAVYEQLSHGLPPAGVGQWVTYHLHGGDRITDAYWRLSVVGSQKDEKGRDAVWLEMELSETAKMVAPLFQMRMLVARAGGLDANGITRVLVALGAGKPQELDSKSAASLGKQNPPKHELHDTGPDFKVSEVHLDHGPNQPMMTAAGTIQAMPVEILYRDTIVERYWVSKQIPVLNLVKVEIPGFEETLELQDYGLDAKPMMHMPRTSEAKLSLGPISDESGGTDAPSQP